MGSNAHVWTLCNGRAIRLGLFLDRERALKALGLQDEAGRLDARRGTVAWSSPVTVARRIRSPQAFR